MYKFEIPPAEEWPVPRNYYQPTAHLGQRYRQRMGGITTKERLRKVMLEATDKKLGLRANYMLLFSIHGRPGDTPNTEVRYYFDWDLVIDNKKKTIITLYQCEVNRRIPARKFGDPKLRKKIYNCWFKQRVMETDANI